MGQESRRQIRKRGELDSSRLHEIGMWTEIGGVCVVKGDFVVKIKAVAKDISTVNIISCHLLLKMSLITGTVSCGW